MSDPKKLHAPNKQCATCIHWRISLFPPKEIELDDKLSSILAHENITRIFCRQNQIVLKESGKPKVYTSKHGLSSDCVVDSGDCPMYEESEALFEDD